MKQKKVGVRWQGNWKEAFVQTKLKKNKKRLTYRWLKSNKQKDEKREMLLNNYLGPCMPMYEKKNPVIPNWFMFNRITDRNEDMIRLVMDGLPTQQRHLIY